MGDAPGDDRPRETRLADAFGEFQRRLKEAEAAETGQEDAGVADPLAAVDEPGAPEAPAEGDPGITEVDSEEKEG